MTKKILLVFAGRKTEIPRLPISCMALAAYVREEGYSPDIIDLRLDDNFKRLNFKEYLCIGISAETGIALKSAINISKYIKENYPEIPIIWGSYHASFLPEETLNNTYVDCIVKGEGEKAFINVIKDIENKGIKGCLKKIYEEKDFMNMEDLPLAAYDLIDLNKYSDAIEGIGYESSRGCPHRCKFCYIQYFHRFKWRYKSPKKVVKEIEYLLKKYQAKKIKFLEDNFFTSKKRALEIAEEFIKKKLDIKWNATIRLDYLSKYTQEELKLLKDAGLYIAILGAESGSQKILDFINKDITTQQIKQAVQNCVKAEIMPQISFMCGFPTETKKDTLETLDFYDEIINLDKEHIEVNSLFIFSPYPGTELYDLAIKYGYKPPKTLEEWSEWQFNHLKNINWFNKSYRKYLHTMALISRFKFFTHRINFVDKEFVNKKFNLNRITSILFYLFVHFYKASAEFRWKRRLFNFAPEWWVYERIRNFTTEIY